MFCLEGTIQCLPATFIFCVSLSVLCEYGSNEHFVFWLPQLSGTVNKEDIIQLSYPQNDALIGSLTFVSSY